MKKRLAKIKKDLRFKQRRLLDAQLGRPSLKAKVKYKKESNYFPKEKKIFHKTKESSTTKMSTQSRKPDKINVFEKFSNRSYNTAYSMAYLNHNRGARRTRGRLLSDKQSRYKSRRFIKTFFRYARWRTRNFDHLLKNMIVTKRYLAYCSGRMRKRQFKAFLTKVNGQINRTTNARMHYVLSFNGLLTNALYQLRFCHPALFKFMGLLICNGYILINERITRYRNAYIQPGDRLEVASEFWSIFTKPNLRYFFFRIGKHKRIKRRYRPNKLKSIALLKQYQRRLKFSYKRERRNMRRKLRRRTRKIRWKFRVYMEKYKRRPLSKLSKPKIKKEEVRQPKLPYFCNRFFRRATLEEEQRVIASAKRVIFKKMRKVFMAWYKLKIYYLILYYLQTTFRKRTRIKRLKRLIYIFLRRHFKAFRFLAFRVARKLIDRYRAGYRNRFGRFGRFRSLKWRHHAANWEICFFTRISYYLTPTHLYKVQDKRFKQSFLWRTLKAYSYFPY